MPLGMDSGFFCIIGNKKAQDGKIHHLVVCFVSRFVKMFGNVAFLHDFCF